MFTRETDVFTCNFVLLIFAGINIREIPQICFCQMFELKKIKNEN